MLWRQRGEGDIAPTHYKPRFQEVGGQRHAPVRFTPGKRPDDNCKGGWGPKDGLDRCGESRAYRDSISGTSSQ